MDLGMYFVEKFRAGESGYYLGRQRGTVAIWHDSTLYLYEQARNHKEFKKAVDAAFAGDGKRVCGKWPNYIIK